MNIIEKQVVKLMWRKSMKKFQRFIPLVAVFYIAALTIARSFGLESVASSLSSIGGLVGIEAMSPVSGAELTAAAAALAGVIIKVYNLVTRIGVKGE